MQQNSTLPPMLALIENVQSDFTQVPNILLDRLAELDLAPPELSIVLQVMRLSKTGAPIFIRTLARRLGSSDRSIQRYVRSLERRGFIKVRGHRRKEDGATTANSYDVGPLIVYLVNTPASDLGAFHSLSLLQKALARYGPGCARCGSEELPTADHVIPKALGGKDRMENIQILCQPHNTEKGIRTIDYRRPLASGTDPA